MSRDKLFSTLQTLRIFSPLLVGEILYSHEPERYKNVHSARVQAQKALNNLVSLGKLERGKGYYRLPGCKSEYKEHAKLLSEALTEVLIAYPDSIIHRELVIPEISLRPDAAILLRKEGKGRCFFIEVVNNETELYLNQKITALRTWKNSLTFLSRLFKYCIPHFDIIITGDSAVGGTLQFKSFLEEVKQVDI